MPIQEAEKGKQYAETGCRGQKRIPQKHSLFNLELWFSILFLLLWIMQNQRIFLTSHQCQRWVGGGGFLDNIHLQGI